MIYFTAYAHMKKDIFHEGRRGKQLSFGELMLAAGISGMPAAYLTTPAGALQLLPMNSLTIARCRQDSAAIPSSSRRNSVQRHF